ncbi:MAG: hypothetical protein AUI36_18945 [Cyanobacteria bacterium 13_1_40CM_2_61_4]|nr:MAG: hypothetical protein AUI36_18945 [Cyanobacteria bacterium 13_1_40CM_2_61_4]
MIGAHSRSAAQTDMALLPRGGQTGIPLLVIHALGYLDDQLSDSQFEHMAMSNLFRQSYACRS